ncbi:Kinetochore protein mis13 [Pichia kudriavzevii]|uniref:Kinetochore protein mis13 n=1 Tax=Pichia kudriavzevii TaxID=4909 RepID=A0A1V2LEG3_PICKU|nr:Kinetochore protein mis13 [Pichia kudriavzevii]
MPEHDPETDMIEEPQLKLQSKLQPKQQSKLQPKQQPKQQPKSQSNRQAKPRPKPRPKQQPKSQSNRQAKPRPKPRPKQEPKPKTKTKAKSKNPPKQKAVSKTQTNGVDLSPEPRNISLFDVLDMSEDPLVNDPEEVFVLESPKKKRKTKGSEERVNLTEKITQEVPQGLRFDKAKKVQIVNRDERNNEENREQIERSVRRERIEPKSPSIIRRQSSSISPESTIPLNDTIGRPFQDILPPVLSRRSSLASRGRRLSNLGNGFQGEPHESIPINELHKHMDISLPEPIRLKQLIVWISKRMMKEEKWAKQKTLIDNFIKKIIDGKVDIDWWVDDDDDDDDDGGDGGGGGDCEKNEEEGGSLGKEAEDVSAVLKVDIPNVDWEEPINKTIETPNTPVLPELTAVWRRLRKFERCISRIHKIHEMVRRVSEHKEDVIVQELENESRIDISKIFGVL